MKDRAWYVGLVCAYCGRRVVGKKDALYVQPIGWKGRSRQPWAEHRACRKEGRP